VSIGEYLAVGGPTGIVLGILGFLLNAYLSKRKDDREERRLDRETETGIVETTKLTLVTVRSELQAMREARAQDRAEHTQQIQAIKAEHALEIAELHQEFGEVKKENGELKQTLVNLRGWA
jgi:hypothetical protein